MNKLDVQTNAATYPIYIENSFNALSEAIITAGLANRKAFILSDANVSPLYLAAVKDVIAKHAAHVHTYVFPAGEHSKSLDTAKTIYSEMLKTRLDRKSVVYALGGGVTGDLAGFVAATFMRGIGFVQLPTSLLAQVDSSVGGKVGVDFEGGKNIIGAFYQPQFVYINIHTLETLPRREFLSGMGEVIKHGLIMDKSYYDFIVGNKEKINAMAPQTLKDIVHGSCRIKSAVVSQDEKEGGLRAILNFGHTFGHAIESLSGFALTHGECVAIGSMAAMHLCVNRGFLSTEDLNTLGDLYRFFQIKTSVSGMAPESIYKQMFLDKKTVNNILQFVLLKSVGQAAITGDVTKEEIMKAAAAITSVA